MISHTNYYGYCPGIAERFSNRDDWVLVLPTAVQQFEQLPARCGSILLKVRPVFAHGKYAGPETLITEYQVTLTGLGLAVSTCEVAGGIIDAAKIAASAEAIKKGQQQKPNF